MKYQRIKIDCRDNSKYTQIAFLVDREDFLKDIFYLRKKWLGKEDETSSVAFEQWFKRLSEGVPTRDELLRKNVRLQKKSQYARELIKGGKKQLAKEVIREMETLFRELPNLNFKGDIETLSLRYKIPFTCFKALCKAIISGQVNEDDWSFCTIVLKPADVEAEKITPSRYIKEPECKIVLSPYAKRAEVDELFTKNIDTIKELYKKSLYGLKIYAGDTVSNIKRDREWYWKNKNGKSYQKIAKEEEAGNIGVVTKAIQQYKKNLLK